MEPEIVIGSGKIIGAWAGGGGVAGTIALLVALKKAGIISFGKVNGKGHPQCLKSIQIESDSKVMVERLDTHDDELKAGKDRFEKMDNRIRKIDNNVGILLDRSGGRPTEGV